MGKGLRIFGLGQRALGANPTRYFFTQVLLEIRL